MHESTRRTAIFLLLLLGSWALCACPSDTDPPVANDVLAEVTPLPDPGPGAASWPCETFLQQWETFYAEASACTDASQCVDWWAACECNDPYSGWTEAYNEQVQAALDAASACGILHQDLLSMVCDAGGPGVPACYEGRCTISYEGSCLVDAGWDGPDPGRDVEPETVAGPDPGPAADGVETDAGPGPACTVFPPDNAWNAPIDELPVHPDSDAFIASIGADDNLHPDFGTFWAGAPIGIPFVLVPSAQPLVDVDFSGGYPSESDPGPYAIPPDAPIEGGPDATGDRHVIAVDMDSCLLYELYHAFPDGDGTWTAMSGAIWDMASNELRPIGWTSADAAGLPIYAGLVRYDEVEAGYIGHALRFTVSVSQQAIVLPATHWASSNTDPTRPPMGLRLRLKAGFDISGFAPRNQVILTALKEFGMIVADNGSDWFVSGEHNPLWDDDELGELKSVPGSAFEVVDTGPVYTNYGDVPAQ